MIDFSALTDSLIDASWSPHKNKLVETVYHYTNAAGLFGILESKKIFAVDRRFMNDSTESLIGIDISKKIIRSRARSAKGPTRIFLERLERLLDTETDEPNFLFSLSDRPDDLSQWRSYSNDGEGFTIGFDTKSIVNLSEESSRFSFGPVSYNSRLYSDRVANVINKFTDLIENNGEQEYDMEDAVYQCDSAITSMSCGHKHSSFRSEREWRINSYPGSKPKSVKVRMTSRGIIPYIELSLNEEGSPFPVTKIGIGPGFRDESINYVVKKLCIQNDIEAEIYNADTPYRRV